MTIDLRNVSAVQSAMFVRIDVPDYEVLLFSDFDRPYTIDEEEYSPLGQLMGISSTSSDLRSTTGELTITISGIPNSSIAEVVNNKFKGSSVRVWRVLFAAATGQPLAFAPQGRFQGIVNNYSIEEEYDASAQSATNTVLFTCSSAQELFNNKIAGRRTNPIDQKLYYPNDVSMDRVLKLANANINFGAPK
jgi:hypothetical protein